MNDNALFPEGVALIVGGSGGIGSAVAKVMAQDGSKIALTYNRNQTVAEAQAKDIANGCTAHACDVTNVDDIATLIETVIAQHGCIHSLIWATGPQVDQLMLGNTPLDKWRHAFDVEVHGLFAMITAILPHMRDNGGGSITHLGSAGHMRWPDGDGLSVAPKAANESLLKGIAHEEGRHGIRANSVLVGVIDAGMFHALMEQGQFPDNWVAETQKMLAIKRWGQPEEIGYAVSFLASLRAAYVTGQQINVSGGFGI